MAVRDFEIESSVKSRLLEHIGEHGMTASSLANLAGVKRGSLYDFFEGKSGISFRTFARVCVNGGVSADYLLGIIGKEEAGW